MSYENYQSAIKKRIDALKHKKRRLLGSNTDLVMVSAIFGFLIAVSILIGIENQNQTAINVGRIIFNPLYEIGVPERIIIPVGSLFVSIVFYFAFSRFVMPKIKSHLPILDCPHCGLGNDLDQYWTCGWCQRENRPSEPFLNDKSIVDRCQHADCQKQSSAFICEHCGEDIVLDITAYNEKQDFGHMRREGVSRLIKRSELNVFFDNFRP